MEIEIPLTALVLDTNTYTRRIDTDIACPINFPDCACVSPYCAKYKLPFFETDIFQFYVSNKPSSASAIDLATNLPIAPNPVSFQGTKLTIDFSLVPLEVNCFYVKYVSNATEYCFEFSFNRAYPLPTNCESSEFTCELSTVLLQSNYTGRDCLGNRYTNGYENTIRVYGYVEYIGTVSNTEETEKKVITSRKIQEKHNFKSTKIPDNSWLIKQLTKSLFYSDSVYVNDTKMYFNGDIEKGDKSLPFWILDLTLLTEPCIINNNCN